MSDHTKTTTGTKPKPKDFVSQIKKDTVTTHDTRADEKEDIDWHERPASDEEDVPQQKKKGVVLDQGKVGTDGKPRKLGDLFDGSANPRPKKQYNKDG
jgi:hypothetical protein